MKERTTITTRAGNDAVQRRRPAKEDGPRVDGTMPASDNKQLPPALTTFAPVNHGAKRRRASNIQTLTGMPEPEG